MEKSKFKSGFTVIELLVVIVIISIVASIGTNTFQNQRRQVQYNDSISHVLSMIQTARNYAVTSRAVFDDSQPVGQKSYIPAEGYGVYIKLNDAPNPSRIVLFANTAAGTDIAKNQFDEGQVANDIIEEDYSMPSETLLTNLLSALLPPTPLSSHTNTNETEAVVIFRPPLADATVVANDHPLSANLLTSINDLYLEFRKVGVSGSIPADYIHVNRVAGLAEIKKE